MATHMEQHIESSHFDHLDRPKSPAFSMDSSPGFYDSYHFDYLQFPHSPFNVAGIPLPPAGSSPRITFDALNSLNLNPGLPYDAYSSGASFTNSPARPFTPPDSICPPALTHLSGGESSDGMPSVGPSGRKSRSNSTADNASPASVHGGLPATRSSHRFNPIATRASARKQRRASKDDFGSDDDEEDFAPTGISPSANSDVRREEIRKQRIESEQRRRDELRDGYRRLKDVLPVSNQKSSKVSLLDRATTHIKYLEMTQQQLQTRLNQAEMETQRLRSLNEALMLSTAERHGAVIASQQPQAF